MDNLIYERQKELKLVLPRHIAVIGCGGVGSWVALLLALSGVKNLSLFDGDNIEASNLNRTLFELGDISQNKASAVREKIIRVRPNAIVQAFPFMVLPGLITSNMEVVMDCTDDSKTQKELYKVCVELGIRYIRAGYNGLDKFTVTDKALFWEIKPQNRYEFIPSWVVPAVLVATLAVMKIVNQNLEVKGDILERITGKSLGAR